MYVVRADLSSRKEEPWGELFARQYPDPHWDLSFVLRKKVSGKDSAVTKAKGAGISRSEMNVVCCLLSLSAVLRRKS